MKCSGCDNKIIYAYGLCRKCYNRKLRARKKGCLTCNETDLSKFPAKKGKQEEYDRLLKENNVKQLLSLKRSRCIKCAPIKCSQCDNKHYGNGLCRKCYSKKKRDHVRTSMACYNCKETDPNKFHARDKIKQSEYDELLSKYKIDKTCIKELIELKCLNCTECSLSPKEKECKSTWIEMKQLLAKRGCLDCADDDPYKHDARVIEADHFIGKPKEGMECWNCEECDPTRFLAKKSTSLKKQEEDQELYAEYLRDGNTEGMIRLKEPLCITCRKMGNLGDYMHWASTADMWVEFKKVEPRCCFHHKIKSEQSRILKDEVVNENKRRYSQANKLYNIQLKRERGECFKCKLKFTVHDQAGFEWCHRNRSEKDKTISEYFSLSPSTAQVKIKSETMLCELQCACCHKLDTLEGK